MFNVGPMELLVLAIVAVVVIGPDRLPKFAKDAAQLLRSLREMATGAREQLRDELGPEFADVDLRNLNPRTALTRAVFGDEDELESLRRMDPRRWDVRSAQDALFRDDADAAHGSVDMSKRASGNGTTAYRGSANGGSANGGSANGATTNGAAPRPRPRPSRPATPYDDDAT
ncbi:sec-independent translocase [uncultured Jatrophihabitans sp.]|uniref:sec-independent translocase n=1 Tax=uncultured Jatrophihabitans sp. TaxID=1610747 RepID=UPI0035CAE9A4